MDNLRLCNAPVSLFVSNGTERDDLVKTGRLLMYEANGRETNRLRVNANLTPQQFNFQLDDEKYKQSSEEHRINLMLYAAKIAANGIGSEAPETYEDFLRLQRDYQRDPVFLRVLSGVVTDTIRPMLPYVISDAVGKLAKTVSVPMGKTYEVNVGSGDIMIFSDSSWGATKSVPKGTLYDKTFTLNPKPASASCTIKFYQLVGNDQDIGVWYNSLAAGMYSYIMGRFNTAMTTAATSAAFTPAYLQFNSYNTANWVNAAKFVSQVNHVPRSSVVGYGDYSALAKVLPSGTAADSALSVLIGETWNRTGFLGTVMGIQTFALENVMVPGTQYTTGTQVMPADVIYMSASVGSAPVWICFEDGTPVTLELKPSDGTADASIDVNLTMSIDVKPICAQKIGVIRGV